MYKISQLKVKNIKKCVYFTAEGTLNKISDIQDFVLEAANKCLKANPKMKCVKNDYCFGQYTEPFEKFKKFSFKYCQAVTKIGKSTKDIKFETLKGVKVIAFEFVGPYTKLKKAHKQVHKWLKQNCISVLDIVEPIREVYIDGPWNKDISYKYKTEIQVPIRKDLEVKT